MKKRLGILMVAALAISLPATVSGKSEEKKAEEAKEKRQKVDQIEKDTLDRLFESSSGAKNLYDKSYGYAVFDNTKISFGLTGGGGTGVAVNMASNDRIYMRMGTGGVALGLGAQVYQVVFLFQNEDSFANFIDKGWEAEASANAVAGTAGANAEATFRNGIALYQLTEAGLMLQADISGTKYWKSKKLN